MRRSSILFVQLDFLDLERHDLVAAVAVLELALDLHDGILVNGLRILVVLEADALHMARRVLDCERGHLRTALGELGHHVGHHADERRRLDFLRALGQVAQLELRHAGNGALVRCKRVLGHVNLHDFLLVGKLGALVPLDAVGRGHVFLETGVLI